MEIEVHCHKRLEVKTLVGGLFCDLQKAFDCVDHDILLSKMKFYGISGSTGKLMKSYLRQRYQRVVINNNWSSWKEVQHGVLQGSILGPLLFLIYINDLSKNISVKSIPILFADDTSFILTSYDTSELRCKTNEVFNIINKWFYSNLLMLNYTKTYFLQFQAKANNGNNTQMLYINENFATVKSIKFLGLTFDTCLNWKNLISDVKTRLNKACYAIRTIKPFISWTELNSTYYSYAQSIMSYGLIFWGNSTDSDGIFRIQKRIIRIITNSNRNASTRELFKKLNILLLHSQYIYSILLFIIKNKDQFPLNSNMHTINTRHKNNIHVTPTNLTM